MKITDVEIIPIYPRVATRNADQKARFREINHRTIFKVKQTMGWWATETPGVRRRQRRAWPTWVDRNPFDFISANLNTGLMGALYDVMGKHLEVPAYKLMGQKVRDRVPVAAWTRPASPEDLAKRSSGRRLRGI